MFRIQGKLSADFEEARFRSEEYRVLEDHRKIYIVQAHGEAIPAEHLLRPMSGVDQTSPEESG
jgi:hypothetical protein